MKFRIFDIVVCIILLVCILVLVVAVNQSDEKEEWINWPKLYKDCEKKVSVEQAQYCAEKDSLECFERCLE